MSQAHADADPQAPTLDSGQHGLGAKRASEQRRREDGEQNESEERARRHVRESIDGARDRQSSNGAKELAARARTSRSERFEQSVGPLRGLTEIILTRDATLVKN